ncbi:helix-turn-helix domain-containing protein [Streptomyces cupreus]|uniref:Uncharacterized protein n=1 Tax=Streptomyces cupreus TaxID=2759956 RepID=A0A7X1J7Y0_9ACTN|nr:hypothetical protein [Streptomyces cupreus]MBC2904817.1 hypothetical protein [Streptomyces cupreus]
MLDFDSSRAVVGLPERQNLIKAVLGASPADEKLWLEWKSTLELNKAAGRFTVAKAILGFANRMPDVASQWAEGHAYVLVGVEPGNLCGTPEFDPADLFPWLTQYTGERLRFDVTYVPFDAGAGTQQVMLVDVVSPQWGDPIHALQKTYDTFQSGTVFVRLPGKSMPARPADIDALSARLLRGERQMDIELALMDGAVVDLWVSESELEELLEARRRELLASLPQPRTPAPRRADRLTIGDLAELAGSGQQFSLARDMRTPEQYRAEVEFYISNCRQQIPAAMQGMEARRHAPLRFQLQNRSDSMLRQVEVIAKLAPACKAVLATSRDAERTEVPWPKPPISYGKKTYMSAVGGFSDRSFSLPGSRYIRPSVPPTPERPGIRSTSEALTIRFPAVDLRPRTQVLLDPITLYGRDLPSDVALRWTATCTNLDGVVAKDLTIPVRYTTVPLRA